MVNFLDKKYNETRPVGFYMKCLHVLYYFAGRDSLLSLKLDIEVCKHERSH